MNDSLEMTTATNGSDSGFLGLPEDAVILRTVKGLCGRLDRSLDFARKNVISTVGMRAIRSLFMGYHSRLRSVTDDIRLQILCEYMDGIGAYRIANRYGMKPIEVRRIIRDSTGDTCHNSVRIRTLSKRRKRLFWTDERIARLKEMYASGLTAVQIAKAFDTTPESVRCLKYRLKHTKRNNNAKEQIRAASGNDVPEKQGDELLLLRDSDKRGRAEMGTAGPVHDCARVPVMPGGPETSRLEPQGKKGKDQ